MRVEWRSESMVVLSWRRGVNGVRVERHVVKIDSRFVCAVVRVSLGVIWVVGESGRGVRWMQLSG
jgi:hypothetical protein